MCRAYNKRNNVAKMDNQPDLAARERVTRRGGPGITGEGSELDEDGPEAPLELFEARGPLLLPPKPSPGPPAIPPLKAAAESTISASFDGVVTAASRKWRARGLGRAGEGVTSCRGGVSEEWAGSSI